MVISTVEADRQQPLHKSSFFLVYINFQAIDKVRNLLNEVPDLVASSDKKLVSEQLNCVIPNFPE